MDELKSGRVGRSMIAFHQHRILPGHMGGTYEPRNVVRVNVAMHAFLHKCLWEEHGDQQDFHAWKMLSAQIGKPSLNLGRVHTAETRAKISAAQVGKTLSADTRAKMSAVRRGRSQSSEWVAKRTAAITGLKASEQTRAKQRARWAAYTPVERAAIGARMSAGKRRKKVVH